MSILPKKIQCKACNNTLFTQAAELYYTSALISKTGQATLEVAPVFYCVNCKTVLDLDRPNSETDNTIQLNNDQAGIEKI